MSGDRDGAGERFASAWDAHVGGRDEPAGTPGTATVAGPIS